MMNLVMRMAAFSPRLKSLTAARTARRQSVACLQHHMVHHNNYFPRAKLARYVRCAALALIWPDRFARAWTPAALSPRCGLCPYAPVRTPWAGLKAGVRTPGGLVPPWLGAPWRG